MALAGPASGRKAQMVHAELGEPCTIAKFGALARLARLIKWRRVKRTQRGWQQCLVNFLSHEF